MWKDSLKCLNEEYNEVMDSILEGEKLDFCRMILPNKNEKFSVTAKYAPCENEREYVTLDKDLKPKRETDLQKFYYGVSPVIDGMKIVKAISKLELQDMNGLEQFVSQNCDKFMLHTNQEEYLLDVAKYIVIALAYNYGIHICLEKEEADRMMQEIDGGEKFLKYNEEKKLLAVHGCPTKPFLELMAGYHFKQQNDSDSVWEVSGEGGYSIAEIYEKEEHLKLLNGDVFYSGVLLRPTKIEMSDNMYTNHHVTSLVFYFERSTYATVFALDNNFLTHPLLKNSGEKVAEFLRYDDKCKEELWKKLSEHRSSSKEYRECVLGAINSYLQATFNVNQIGVTGNIITKDGYLLVGKRSSNAIDQGHFYPSVNGNAEVVDKDVEFYNKSIYEDYPEIRLNDERIHFLGELCREAYAELGLDLLEKEWRCIGITISGNVPKNTNEDEYSEKFRRCHFNVLCEQECDETYGEVVEKYEKATENYENTALYGIKAACYKDMKELVASRGKAAAENLLQSKDIIESIMLFTLFLFSIQSIKKITLGDVQTIVSVLFAILIILTTMVRVCIKAGQYWKNKKYLSKVNVLKTSGNKDADIKVKKILQNHSYHPVTYVALKLYVDRYRYERGE